MNTTVLTAFDIVLRVAAAVVGEWAFTAVYEAVVPAPIGADIGEGLLFFGLLIGASGAWAAWDARNRGFVRVAVTWVLTGLLAGGWSAFSTGLGDPGNSMALMLDDLRNMGPFLAGLIIVPALCSGGLVTMVRATSLPVNVAAPYQPPYQPPHQS